MLALWATFWTEFREQTLFTQISFLIPLIGIPTVVGIFSNWSTKARLRKIAEGREAEIRLLRAECARLKAESLSTSIQEAAANDEAYVATDFSGVFERNKDHLVQVCEHLANEKLIAWWLSKSDSDRQAAIYFSNVASTIEPASLIGRTILALARDNRSETINDSFSQVLSTPRHTVNPATVDAVSLNIANKCNELVHKGEFHASALHARYGLLYVQSHGILRSVGGYNIAYSLIRALIFNVRGRALTEDEKHDLKWSAELFLDIVETTFRDPDHLAQFIAKFHYASALHMLGKGETALELLERDRLPDRVGACVGEKSSACFATKHLYANLLYEAHRPMEATKVVLQLTKDLKAANSLSKEHVQTYQKWAALARSAAYGNRQRVVFRNAGNLMY